MVLIGVDTGVGDDVENRVVVGVRDEVGATVRDGFKAGVDD